jgi:hypothetical protein
MNDMKLQGVESGGFLFLNGADAVLADKERKQIEYLEKKLDYQKPEQVLSVFQKLIEERTFKTPVGMLYLKKMQDFLLKKAYLDKERIPYIPVDTPCDLSVPKQQVELKSVKNVAKKREEIKISNHKISVFMNVILIFALILMFVIALKSETPNMLNYKSALENKYATWEQELTEKEAQLREKERELKLQE